MEDEAIRQTRDVVPQRVKRKAGRPASGRDVEELGTEGMIRTDVEKILYSVGTLKQLDFLSTTGEQSRLGRVHAEKFVK